MPAPERLLQKHFANLGHIRTVFQIDPRVEAGPVQVAPWLSRVVQLVHPTFPGAFQFATPVVRAFPAPAAGADFVITVPPNEIWRLRALRVNLTTSVAAGNRILLLSFNDTVNTFLQLAPSTVSGPSTNNNYSWANLGYAAAQIERNNGMPEMFLNTGWQVTTAISGVDVADQLGIQTVLIEVFPA